MANPFPGLSAFTDEQSNREQFWLDALFPGNGAADFARAVGMVIPDLKVPRALPKGKNHSISMTYLWRRGWDSNPRYGYP